MERSIVLVQRMLKSTGDKNSLKSWTLNRIIASSLLLAWFREIPFITLLANNVWLPWFDIVCNCLIPTRVPTIGQKCRELLYVIVSIRICNKIVFWRFFDHPVDTNNDRTYCDIRTCYVHVYIDTECTNSITDEYSILEDFIAWYTRGYEQMMGSTWNVNHGEYQR